MSGSASLDTVADLRAFAAASTGVGAHGRPAGFWLRVGAVIIDTIVTMLIGLVTGAVVGFVLSGFMMQDGVDPRVIDQQARLIGTGLGFVLGLLYYPVLESSGLQGTFGKRALGLRVVRTDGGRIGFWRALFRYLAKSFSALILGIGFLMAGWTKRKQALHDMIVETLVVRA